MKFFGIKLFALFLAVMAIQSCQKESDDFNFQDCQVFYLNTSGFTDENGAKISIPGSWNRILFTDSDKVYINDTSFEVRREGSSWYAYRINKNQGPLEADIFYCIYHSDNASHSLFGDDNYTVNFMTSAGNENNLIYKYNSGITLAGATTDSTLTMFPTCAFLRITDHATMGLDELLVGFQENKIPKTAVVYPQYKSMPTITANSMMAKMQSTSNPFGVSNISGDMLVANQLYAEDNVYYVAIPIAGNSVTTNIYFRIKLGSNTLWSKKENVTLQPGFVYSITEMTVSKSSDILFEE